MGRVPVQTPIPCPDNIRGCAVNHYSWSPQYSTKIQDAWLVIEKLYEKKQIRMFVSNNFHPLWEARCKKENGDWVGHGVDDETAPMAICKAALKAVGMEVS
jgi:hypothetical protein